MILFWVTWFCYTTINSFGIGLNPYYSFFLLCNTCTGLRSYSFSGVNDVKIRLQSVHSCFSRVIKTITRTILQFRYSNRSKALLRKKKPSFSVVIVCFFYVTYVCKIIQLSMKNCDVSENYTNVLQDQRTFMGFLYLFYY